MIGSNSEGATPRLAAIFAADLHENGVARVLRSTPDQRAVKAALVHHFDRVKVDRDSQKRIFAMVYDAEVADRLKWLQSALETVPVEEEMHSVALLSHYFRHSKPSANSLELSKFLNVILNNARSSASLKALVLREVFTAYHAFHPEISRHIGSILRVMPDRDDRAVALAGLIQPAAQHATEQTLSELGSLIDGDQNVLLIYCKGVSALSNPSLSLEARNTLSTFLTRLQSTVVSDIHAARLKKYFPLN